MWATDPKYKFRPTWTTFTYASEYSTRVKRMFEALFEWGGKFWTCIGLYSCKASTFHFRFVYKCVTERYAP